MSIPILANRFKQAEYVRQAWHISPRPEDAPEAMLDPKYWVHVSKNMKPGDRIEAIAESREWLVDAVVLDAGSWGAKVAFILGPVKLANDAKIEAPDEYEVKWAGPSAKFRVVRKTDNKVLKDECQTKEEAATWIKNHRVSMAA